jgi:hypothetical protein
MMWNGWGGPGRIRALARANKGMHCEGWLGRSAYPGGGQLWYES